MARLTWDSVANPNFSGVSDSYRAFSQLLGQAADSGIGMLNTFRNANATAADRAILERMAGVTDPTQFNAASIIGGQGSAASIDTLESVGSRMGTLLDWATNSERLKQDKFTNERIRDSYGRMDGAQDAIREFGIASRNGDQATVNNLLRTNPQLANLRADQVLNLMTQGDGLTSSLQGRQRNDQNLLEAVYRQSRTERGDQITDATAEAKAWLARNAADPAHAEQLAWAQNYRPEVMNNLLASGIGSAPAGSGGGGVAAPSTGGITAALAGTVSSSPIGNSGAVFSTPQRTVATALQGAGLSAPVIAGIMGNLHVEGGYGNKAGGDSGTDKSRADGGQASGIAQWRQGRRDAFKQRYGVDPHQGTHQQQAEYMLWELTTPEGRRSAGISEANAQAIMNAQTPQEAAELFDRYYERSNGAHRDRRVSAANDFAAMFNNAAANYGPVENANTQADIQRANTEANSGSLNARLSGLEGKDIDMDVLTKGLMEGPYAGYTQGELAQEIRAIAAEGKLNNAQAAEIMKENFVPRSTGMGAVRGLQNLGNNIPIVNWFVPDGGVATNTFDRANNLASARQYREGGLTTLDQNNTRALASTQLATVQKQIDDLTTQITSAQQRAAQTRSPEIMRRVEQLQLQRAMLLPQYRALQLQQERTPGLTTRDFEAEARRAEELVRQALTPVATSRGSGDIWETGVPAAANIPDVFGLRNLREN